MYFIVVEYDSSHVGALINEALLILNAFPHITYKKEVFPHIDPSGCSCVDRKSSDLGLGGIRREYLQTVYFQIRNLSLCLCLDDEKLTESEENRNFMFLLLFSDYIHDI